MVTRAHTQRGPAIGALLLGASLVLSASLARAEQAPTAALAPVAASPLPPEPATGSSSNDSKAVTPRVHHAPVASVPEKVPVPLRVRLDNPELVRAVYVVYRSASSGYVAAKFARSESEAYVAILPPEAAKPPTLQYTIEIERTDGTMEAVFATRAAPHVVQVLEDEDEARERALLTRLLGRRNVATVSGELVRFGETQPTGNLTCGAGQDRCAEGTVITPAQAAVTDQYYRVEAGYTFRPLGVVAEFSIRGGIIRGTSLVPGPVFDEGAYEVGANYGAPTVLFRLADSWHLETELLTSITEVGFSVGFGSALRIGDPFGSRLTVGFETIGPGNDSSYFGSRFYSRLDIATAHALTLAPIIEVTDMPHADSFGVRLLGEAALELGHGFAASVRGGYQARRSTSGGPSLGGSLSLAF
jgi:hypothetical protein